MHNQRLVTRESAKRKRKMATRDRGDRLRRLQNAFSAAVKYYSLQLARRATRKARKAARKESRLHVPPILIMCRLSPKRLTRGLSSRASSVQVALAFLAQFPFNSQFKIIRKTRQLRDRDQRSIQRAPTSRSGYKSQSDRMSARVSSREKRQRQYSEAYLI